MKILLLVAMLCLPALGYCQSDDTTAQPNFPLIEFEANSRTFTPATEQDLTQIATDIKRDPSLRIVIVGNGGGTKYDQQLSWAHVDAVIVYMSEVKNIDRNTFIARVDGDAPANAVKLRAAYSGETGPSTVVQPFPNIIIK